MVKIKNNGGVVGTGRGDGISAVEEKQGIAGVEFGSGLGKGSEGMGLVGTGVGVIPRGGDVIIGGADGRLQKYEIRDKRYDNML